VVCPTILSEEFSPSRTPLLGFSLEPDDAIISRRFCGSCTALPVQRRVDYKLACFVFSSLSGHASPYLADDIHLDLGSESHRRRLRSSTDRSCTVPRTHNTFGDRSFAVAGPRVWNSLPAHFRNEDVTYNSFRRELKETFLF